MHIHMYIQTSNIICYTYNTTFNVTSMTLLNIAQKVDYLFTVVLAGVDTGGRMETSSASYEFVTLHGRLKYRKKL